MAEEYDLAVVRSLLDAAFNPGEIRTLAFDLFQSVYRDFAPGIDRRQMIEAIVDYANRYGRILELLDYVKQRNSYQYGRYADRLKLVPQTINQEPRDITSYLQPQYDFQYLDQVDEPVRDSWYTEELLPNEDGPAYADYGAYSDTDESDSDGGGRFKTLMVIVIVIAIGYGIYSVFFAGKLTIRAVSIDPIAPVLYAATNKGVLKINTETTSIEGFIIPPQASLQNSRAILVVDNETFSSFYADYNGQIYKTDDAGNTWANPISLGNIGTIFSLVKSMAQPNGGFTYFSGTFSGVYRSVSSKEWEPANAGLAFSSFSDLKLVVHPDIPGALYAITGNRIFYTEDSGTSWQELALPWESQEDSIIERVLVFAIDSTLTPSLLYLGTDRGLYKKGEVEGEAWALLSETAGLSYYSIITVPVNSVNTLYVGTTKGMLKSTDSGETWFSQVILEGKMIRELVIHPRNATQLFAVTGDSQIYGSNDSGHTWHLIFGGL